MLSEEFRGRVDILGGAYRSAVVGAFDSCALHFPDIVLDVVEALAYPIVAAHNDPYRYVVVLEIGLSRLHSSEEGSV
jgi:hypothetical protein